MLEGIKRQTSYSLTHARIELMARIYVRHERFVGVTSETETKIRGEFTKLVGHFHSQTYQGVYVILHRQS